MLNGIKEQSYTFDHFNVFHGYQQLLTRAVCLARQPRFGRSSIKLVLCGDLNSPHVHWEACYSECAYDTILLNFISKHNMTQKVYLPARGSNNLDLIHTSDDFIDVAIDHPFLSHYSLSDHIPLLFSLPLFCPNDEPHIQPGQRFSYCKGITMVFVKISGTVPSPLFAIATVTKR